MDENTARALVAQLTESEKQVLLAFLQSIHQERKGGDQA